MTDDQHRRDTDSAESGSTKPAETGSHASPPKPMLSDVAQQPNFSDAAHHQKPPARSTWTGQADVDSSDPFRTVTGEQVRAAGRAAASRAGRDFGKRRDGLPNFYRDKWAASLQRAEQMIAAQEGRLRSFRSVLGDTGGVIKAPLAALMISCEAEFGNSAPHTIAAAVTGLMGDTAHGSDAVSEQGEVTPGTIAYKLLAPLYDYDDAGVAEPRAAIEAWIDHVRSATIAEAITTAAVGRGNTYNGGSNHEYSSLNFTVPTVPPSGRSLAEIRADLDSRPGLLGIKDIVEQFAATEQINGLRRARGLKVDQGARHMVFTGNPGTGKTTVARLIAEVLHATGSMPDAHLVEADRSMLVGEWLGSSAMKTRKVAEAAFGGVLFVDEAYSLAGSTDGAQNSDRFAHEALATLVKTMEDDRDELVVILAGYPAGMDNLVRTNQGLASRVGMHVHFPDYGDTELVDILLLMAAHGDYELAEDALAPFEMAIDYARLSPGFGNARWVRSVFEGARRAQAVRLSNAMMSGIDVTGELPVLRMSDIVAGLRNAG